ncbi:MAG TPA: VOC family protein [Acidimicrobiales bacterium]|nr:VOC family protein [Acidimicrobiales bacterium]
MSTTEDSSRGSSLAASTDGVDMKLEVVIVPVSDVDRAKEFYEQLGWRLDADVVDGDFRLVQFTPPGAGCSIQFGTNLTPASPGSAQGLHLVVSDIEAARDDLVRRGVEVSEVYHCATGLSCRFDTWANNRVSGLAPGRSSYGSFASFRDPDGNGWLLQEVRARFPGRVGSAGITFGSAGDLAGALRRARTAHGAHERHMGEEDASWPDWYAAYIAAEQSGAELPR